MSYHANVAAVLYLYQRIMPLIWLQRPEVTLTLVGSRPPRSVQALARDPRVEVTGYVDDIRPYVRRAQVMLSPMVYSVGLQNKVLQAMALGTPVVASAASIAALNARPGRDLLVASSAEEFAEEALGLMRDSHLHAAMSRYGRAYVEQFHDWHVMTNHLVTAYQRAIATHASKDSSNTEQQLAVVFP
jgi:polysaccharide biosynthesis protein PslH